MSDNGLTSDEKHCLQMWFRQAIAKVEQERVVQTLLQRDAEDGRNESTHRIILGRRRLRRVKQVIHRQKALV